ncbi:MAG: hypothetical protein ACPHO0_05540 [Luminiphilus sp.]
MPLPSCGFLRTQALADLISDGGGDAFLQILASGVGGIADACEELAGFDV